MSAAKVPNISTMWFAICAAASQTICSPGGTYEVQLASAHQAASPPCSEGYISAKNTCMTKQSNTVTVRPPHTVPCPGTFPPQLLGIRMWYQ